MAEATITINPAKRSELEFDVIIQGMDKTIKPLVKLAFTSTVHECDFTFKCSPVDDDSNKWVAKLPVLSFMQESTAPFRVEVIVDGYYFEPANGTATFVTDPTVKFQPSTTKPTVTTSFTVKQTDEPVVTEAGGGMAFDTTAPTNNLLYPEYPPEDTHVHDGQASVEDQMIDHNRLSSIASSVTPGQTALPVEAPVDTNFDPREVAASIVKQKIKSIPKSTSRGSLFKRGADGKPIVAGLDTPATRAAKVANQEKVRQILS